MLFTDEDLLGPQPEQLDLFDDTETTNQEVPVPEHKIGDSIRYDGSVARAHGTGYIRGIDARGRLTIRVCPDQADPWTPYGWMTVTRVRPGSVTLLGRGVEYGDEPGVIDLWGAGQLSLAGV